MKVRCEVAEKGILVNPCTTYATEKLVNSIAIIPNPQNIKNKASGLSVSCHPGVMQCLTKKKNTTNSLSLINHYWQGGLLAFLSPAQRDEGQARDPSQKVTAKQQRWETIHLLHPSHQVRRKNGEI